MPFSMKPGETRLLRYHPAHKPAPRGWRDVGDIGPHLWRGKIIVKERRWSLSWPWRFFSRLLRRRRRGETRANASRL